MTFIQFLSGWIGRSSILILSGAALVWFLRVKNPSIRLAAWIAILAGSLGIPFLTAVLPGVPVEVRFASKKTPVLTVPASGTNDLLRTPQAVPNTVPAPASARPIDWMRLAATLYTLTVCLLLLRLVLGVALSIQVFRRSSPTGREAEETQVRESDQVASPVTVGVLRPAILLPLDWREWDSAKLNAVLAHEGSHVRRFDPAVQFISAIHRALLWANPLSWFLHRSIVRTAEEVSDGDAIAAIGDRVSYAETLLGLMQRGVGQTSWLGVPMALYDRPERRIRRILNSAVVTRGLTRRSVAAIVVLAAPLAWLTASVQTQSATQTASVPAAFVFAPSPAEPPAPIPKPAPSPAQAAVRQAPAESTTKPEFEAASIKPVDISRGFAPGIKGGPGTSDPERISFTSSLKGFLMAAYGVGSDYISGPAWLDTNPQPYRIEATIRQGATKEQFSQMLQNLLNQRFQITMHREIRDLPLYELTVAGKAPQLKEYVANSYDDGKTAGRPAGGGPDPGYGRGLPEGLDFPYQYASDGVSHAVANKVSIAQLIKFLSAQLKRPVVDKTGLTGLYNYNLDFMPVLPGASGTGEDLSTASAPDLIMAVRVQLGMKLTARKDSLEIIVIDHAEKTPTEN